MSECLQCGNRFTNISTHWAMSSSCDYPSLSEEQLEVLTGILIGDGSLDRSGANCRIKIEMINEKYLKYVDSVLGNLSNGVSKTITAEENAKKMRESGFRPNANSDNYSDVYKLTTKRHPEFNNLESWYGSNGKVIPKMELTPTILKHWYVCDGHLIQRDESRPRVAIGITNEYKHSNKLEQMFIEQGIDANATKSKNLDIGVDHTEKFFDFIGEPIDGFKYKWP